MNRLVQVDRPANLVGYDANGWAMHEPDELITFTYVDREARRTEVITLPYESDEAKARLAAAREEWLSRTCPNCGPTITEPHPRMPGVSRCGNCKEHLCSTE